MESTRQEAVFQGIAASPGIAHGKIFLLAHKEISIPQYAIAEADIEREIGRLDDAIVVTRKQIQKIQNDIRGSLSEDEARIFDAHLMVLEDQALIAESIAEMRSKKLNIEAMISAVGQRYIAAFDKIDDEYLRERAADIRDVLRRLLGNMTGQQMLQIGELVRGKVLVSRDVTPSDSASVDKSQLLGIVTDGGSKTSHAVIVARSLNIPAVVGLGDFSSKVGHDMTVLVDGYEGKVILHPSEDTLYRYGKLKDERRSIEKRMLALSKQASRTRDGHPVQLMANIEKTEEAVRALEVGADGIGLYRTEFLFMDAHRLPSEEEQFEAYKSVVEAMKGLPVVIRTLDLGGDKIMDAADFPLMREANPFLGYRAIRFCLDHENVFKAQLRAILRASSYGNLKVMYPMVSGVQELRQANEMLELAKQELRSEGVPFNEGILTGSMIEIPSAAIAADTLVGDSSFFSIGTNDLIQYMIAVDRLNDRVAHLYEPTHPAILRVIRMVVEAAHRGEIPVSICGEVAGDPVMVPLLIGMGVETLSMASALLPNVKFVVQNMDLAEARDLAKMAMEETNPSIVLERLLDFYTSRMATLF